MKRTRAVFCLCALAALAALAAAPGPLHAGGALESFDITANEPVPGFPPLIVAPMVPLRWDNRCVPVSVRANSSFDPIPNPLGAPVITLAQAENALRSAFASWNNVRTSYIKLDLVGRVANPNPGGFDMVNEATFIVPPGSGFIGVSVPTNLIADFTMTDGLDIDGDGDSDVSSTISRCRDFDGDGDIEFAAGFYEAGTILDNDVLFNSDALRFTVNDADIDTNFSSVDLQAVAVHEYGHAHGLSHTMINQVSDANGNAATMFPFIDTGDPATELAFRSLEVDDAAYSSFFYPEGSAASGPAALQLGDIPFKLVYGIVQGEATDGPTGQPLAGGSVFAVNSLNGQQKATAFTGTTQLAYDPGSGGLFLIDPTFNIIDGRYRIPLPLGIYKIGIEAVDGAPVSPPSINFTVQIGAFFGQQTFNEEFWNGPGESALENRPGLSLPVIAVPSVTTPNVDITTNVTNDIARFGGLDSIGFTGVSPGTYYAVRFPAALVAALDPASIHTGLFFTQPANASVVPPFDRAVLATGSVNPGTGVATIDLANPLRVQAPFFGQDGDFTPFYFSNPVALKAQILDGIDNGTITDLFLVLRIPTTTPYPGVSGLPPFIGLDLNPPFGTSYFSSTGASFSPVNFNFLFALSSTPQ